MGALKDAVADMAKDARNLYGPTGWQKALRVAVHIVKRGGMVYLNVPADRLDAMTDAMATYIAEGDAYNMLDPMIAFGYYAVDADGREWTGKPQKFALCDD